MERKFDVVNSSGETITLYYKEPDAKAKRIANLQKNNASRDAIKSGAYFEREMITILQDRGIVGEEFNKKLDEARTDLNKMLDQLDAGGIKLNEARMLAININKKRAEIRNMLSEVSSYNNDSVEGQAQNAWFNAIVSSSIVYDRDHTAPYFESYDDYLSRSAQPDTIKCAQFVAESMFGLLDESQLPENKFLIEYKFVDKDLRYIDKDGNFIDEDGHLVDELGRRIKIVDGNKVLVDEEDNPIKSNNKKPFLDDDGNPIELDTKTSE